MAFGHLPSASWIFFVAGSELLWLQQPRFGHPVAIQVPPVLFHKDVLGFRCRVDAIREVTAVLLVVPNARPPSQPRQAALRPGESRPSFAGNLAGDKPLHREGLLPDVRLKAGELPESVALSDAGTGAHSSRVI